MNVYSTKKFRLRRACEIFSRVDCHFRYRDS